MVYGHVESYEENGQGRAGAQGRPQCEVISELNCEKQPVVGSVLQGQEA